jgi:hypothetical protein
VTTGESSGALSYAQFQSLEKGMSADTVLETFGRAMGRVGKEGRIAALTYRCEDAQGEVRELRLEFDAGGILERWSLK